ncbi:uncharacterized protein LOC132264939 [Phlebotomus argentipes]|uniref:uncharacterized protein LOC132264939 n=1 Tax=Phlebotomus argentipes TaxID=94469 RepID=UPI002892FD22|nr:uncharacterized protein LOC132264939 [Phlebotomus argentipes]
MSEFPNWLTDDYIKKIFNDFFDRERKLKEPIDWDVDLQFYEKHIENIATKLFKVKVTNKKDPKEVYSAFVKTLCESSPNNFQLTFSLQEIMFEREGEVYEDFISKLPHILPKIEECELRFPKLYHFSKNPLVVVIEDVSQEGFEKFPDPYSLDDCRKVFQHLAKFHAFSYFLHHELNIDMSKFTNFIWKDLAKNVPIVNLAYGQFIEVVSSWEGCSEFAEKLRKFQPHYCDAIIDSSHPKDDGFNVLSHADFHKHNLLFRNNKKDCVVIDYQLSAWRSPAYDIIGAFNIFCEPEDNINSRDILLSSYHKEFKFILRKLGFSHRIPTLLDLHVEVLKCGILDVVYWSIYNPMGALSENPGDKRQFIVRYVEALNSSRQRQLAAVFPTFLNRGYLDCDEND